MTPESEIPDAPPPLPSHRELWEIQRRVAALVDDLAQAVAELRTTIGALSREEQ